jgi:hypothetical protein
LTYLFCTMDLVPYLYKTPTLSLSCQLKWYIWSLWSTALPLKEVYLIIYTFSDLHHIYRLSLQRHIRLDNFRSRDCTVLHYYSYHRSVYIPGRIYYYHMLQDTLDCVDYIIILIFKLFSHPLLDVYNYTIKRVRQRTLIYLTIPVKKYTSANNDSWRH